MLRQLGLTLFCAAATLSSTAYTAPQHILQAGVSIEYQLPPNEPQIFANPLFWPINADCKIISEINESQLYALGLAKKGKINGISISKDDTLRLTVLANETVKISADAGAKVEITNESTHQVKIHCSA